MKIFKTLLLISFVFLASIFFQIKAQTNTDIFDLPILAVPKGGANAGERAIVIITWEGSFETKLKVGDIETTLKSGEQIGAKLVTNKPLAISLQNSDKKKYSSTETLIIENEMAHLNIGFTNNKVTFNYETFSQKELRLKNEEAARLEAKLKEDLKKSTLNKILDSIELNMVLVEGGDFMMGCADGEKCYTENKSKPAFKVTLSSYYISKFEVTREQWRWIMGKDIESRYNEVSCDDKCPVENVKFKEVQEFITKLNELTGKEYRLPTEAEWEFAARGGNKSKGFIYSGSNTLDEVAWHSKNHGYRIHPVGSKLPNELGIYDMSGSVYEWCGDYSCKYDSTPKVNPKCSDDGWGEIAIRGGSIGVNSEMTAVNSRSSSKDNYNSELIGFRLAHSK